jgi:hypothetical protein
MECATDSRAVAREAWDRLALILLAEPRADFEEEYREAAIRELSRLADMCCEQESGA